MAVFTYSKECYALVTSRRQMLGSDADASYLDEIQVIELLVLVPALRAPSSVCAHASPHAYDPALHVPKPGRPLSDRSAP